MVFIPIYFHEDHAAAAVAKAGIPVVMEGETEEEYVWCIKKQLKEKRLETKHIINDGGIY